MATKETTKDVKSETQAKTISTRGSEFVGTVTSDKMARTVTVEWEYRQYVPKYERYKKKRSKVKAHNPDEIAAKVGDVVRIKETRPISKTKHFVVVEIMEAAQQ